MSESVIILASTLHIRCPEPADIPVSPYQRTSTLLSEYDAQQHEALQIHSVAFGQQATVFDSNTVANSTLSAQQGRFYPTENAPFLSHM